MLKRIVKATAASATVATVAVIGLGQAAGAQEGQTYVVQPGDYLSRIAPSNWRAVAAFNEIPDPDLIHPGQVLRLDVPADFVVPSSDEGSWSGESSNDGESGTDESNGGESWTDESDGGESSNDGQSAPEPAPAASSGGGTVWDSLAECESGGDWSINTGNGYYGGLQFSQDSWNAAGGSGNPANASREEQIRVAENLVEQQGWGAWPACSSKLGLR